jgi:hypothetical protein
VLLQPTTGDGALRFIDQVLASQQLRDLVAATGPVGLAAMRRDFGAARDALGGAERDQVQRILSRWAGLGAAGADAPGGSDGGRQEQLQRLRLFARDRWDMRCGRERDRIPTSIELLADPVVGLVRGLARDWGMVGPLRASGSYGAAVALGGILPSSLNRSASAAAMLAIGDVSFPLVVGLASQRPLTGSERRQAAALGAMGGTEAHTMAYGLASAFGVDPGGWHSGHGLWEQTRDDGLRLAVTHVPLRPDGSRPNTGESFDWLLRTGLLDVGAGLLCVTTPLYWIQNHINLLTRLPLTGTVLVTAGGTADGAAVAQPRYLGQHLLQEIKSAIDALPELLAWASR